MASSGFWRSALARLLFLPPWKDEIIFGTKRAGATRLHSCSRVKRNEFYWLLDTKQQPKIQNENNGRSAYFHRTCLWFCHGPLPRLPRTKTNPPGVSANIVRNTQGEADRASVARRIDRTLKPIHRLFWSGRFTRDIRPHCSCLVPQRKSPDRPGRMSRSSRPQTRF